jgi:hypothetical protein
MKFISLKYEMSDAAQVFSDFQQLYEFPNLPKRIPDGGLPFPEVSQDLKQGLSIEFR